MSKNLYSAYMSAGKSSGEYKASLFETSDWADKFDFIGKQTAWEQEKASRRVGVIADSLSFISTIGGGFQDKEKMQSRAKSLEGKYGKLQPDTRSKLEQMFGMISGKEQTYTFGEGDSAVTFSQQEVTDKYLKSDMLGEYQERFYGDKGTSPISFDIPKKLDINPPKLGGDKSFASAFSKIGNQPINTNTQNTNSYDMAMTKAQMMEKAGLKLPPTLTGR